MIFHKILISHLNIQVANNFESNLLAFRPAAIGAGEASFHVLDGAAAFGAGSAHFLSGSWLCRCLGI